MVDLQLIHASFVQTHCDQYPSSEAVGPVNACKGIHQIRFQKVFVLHDLDGVNLSMVHPWYVDGLHANLVTDVIADQQAFQHVLTLIPRAKRRPTCQCQSGPHTGVF